MTHSPITSTLGFSADMEARPKFHANDTSRDVLNIKPHDMPIYDARDLSPPPSLDVEGFALRTHKSAVKNFMDIEEVNAVHAPEIIQLLLEVSGADFVDIAGPGILRFGERSPSSGALNNSRPARFVHIDVSKTAAQSFYERSRPDTDRKIIRTAQYNVWRALTPPPQDVPLAVCDARTISPDDLICSDSMFDVDGKIVWSFESYLIRYNPNQRWYYYSDMTLTDALIFKTTDTDETRAQYAPHGAFDNPLCPEDAPPRASLEMRGTAFWYG